MSIIAERFKSSLALPALSLLLVLALPAKLRAAQFTEWQHRQSFDISSTGLARVSLPAATLDALRPGLDDLRIADAAGNEVPVLIERARPEPPPIQAPKSFRSSLQPGVSVLLIETGLALPIDTVALETPERDFIKAVRVEGSTDGRAFAVLVDGAVVFRQSAASELAVRLPKAIWPWLRITLDDQRSRPIPFTNARVHAAVAAETKAEPSPVSVKSREEQDGETRLVVDLGSANLTLATLEFESPETLFQREIIVRVAQIAGDEIRESEAARGAIYSIDNGASKPLRRLTLDVERLIPTREIAVLIRNLDSPPLQISSIRATRRPVVATFRAATSGTYFLYAGNSLCPAPRYDLAMLAEQLTKAPAAAVSLGPLTSNPDFRAPEILAGLAELGAALDTSSWRFRKPVRVTQPGPQQLELDLDVLAQAAENLGDLRLVRNGNQVPYLLQRTSATRALMPSVSPANDPQHPRISRWMLKLQRPHLPINRLQCRTRTTLFQRHIRVWEEIPDGRGGKVSRDLGSADWRRTLESKDSPLSLTLTASPETDTVFVETDNGENTPLDLDAFQVFYTVVRLVFKTTEEPMLYYGSPAVSSPRYDLSLIAPKLLAAEKAIASLGSEETLKKAGWTEGEPLSGVRGWIFWGVLGLVIVGLVAVLAKLLPKPSPEDSPGDSK
jgi:hypothetical protein